MRVLVFCEFSGVVLEAFLAGGHDAYSADLLPTESVHKDRHYQGDGRWLLLEPWDLVIAHPPCTDLTRARGRISSADKVGAAIDFFVECYRANAPRVAVENPIPFRAVSRFLGPPQCKVDPYNFGDDWRKRTWWWTRGLPPLLPMMDSENPGYICPSNSSTHKGRERSSIGRARFFPGMAAAMAKQWGGK